MTCSFGRRVEYFTLNGTLFQTHHLQSIFLKIHFIKINKTAKKIK